MTPQAEIKKLEAQVARLQAAQDAREEARYAREATAACPVIASAVESVRAKLPAGTWSVQVYDGGVVVEARGVSRQKAARRRAPRARPAAAVAARILRLVPPEDAS